MKTETDILKLLEAEPDRGITLLMEQYMGLVHSVASGLPDPEDVKECINSTFADFYRYRNSFDPGKGSLANYLAAIARRNCIDIAVRNQKHSADPYPENAGHDPVNDWNEQMDVRSAVDRLPAMDAELIRMKYYEGKTLSEIAGSLGISYEAAKKRHQRSLRALKKSLIAILILALLAALTACAVMVLRHFGILPGYGILSNPEETHYVLTESQSIQGERFYITLEDAWLQGDTMQVRLRYDFPADIPQDDIHGMFNKAYLAETFVQPGSSGGTIRAVRYTGYFDEGYAVIEYSLSGAELTEDENGLICSLIVDGTPMDFRVDRQQPEQTEQAGFTVITNEGGFCAIPRIENGHLYVQIYPIDIGSYTIDRNLSAYYMKYQFGLTGDVTATAEDGTVLTGAINRNVTYVSDAFYEWDFGEAEAGNYVLNIPFVFVNREYTAEEWAAHRTEISFSDQKSVELEIDEGKIVVGAVETQEPAEDGQYHWWIPVKTELDSPYRLLMASVQFLPEYAVDPGLEMIEIQFSPVLVDGRMTGYDSTSVLDVLSAQVWIQKLTFLWECDISIPVQVNEQTGLVG